MQNMALLLVDLQEDFISHPDLVPARQDLINAATSLLSWARGQGLPVFHVHTRVRADGSDAMPHWQRRGRLPCTVDSDGVRPPLSLCPLGGEQVFYKRFFDPFEDPQLATALQRMGVRCLLISGVHTHACIRQAALSTYAHGLEAMIVTDAVASYDPEHAQKTLDWLDSRAAILVKRSALIHGGLKHCAQVSRAILYNPCNCRQQLFHVTCAASQEVDDSLLRLVKEQKLLAQLQPALRTGLLREWRTHLRSERSHFLDLLVSDLGKPLRDAEAEFDYGMALLQSAIDHCKTMQDPGVPIVNYQPLGIVGVITPWNNPFALAVGKIAPALVYGNAVAWKPALPAWRIAAKMHETLSVAGLGRYVALLPGEAQVGEQLIAHPAVSAVAFTGSADVGGRIAQQCVRSGKRFQGEMGASNAAIVLHDADIAAAAQDLAAAMFSFAGQRCTAIRRLIVDERVIDEFRAVLAAEVANLRVGIPQDGATQVGPMISESARSRLGNAIQEAVKQGAQVVAQASLRPDANPAGAWLVPTVLEGVSLSDPLWQQEQFGPVAVLKRFRGFEEAIALSNSVRYGLLGVVYTRSSEAARSFAEAAQVGLCSINQARPQFSPQGPFFGWKDSGSGIAEHGRWNRDFYTRVQAVYDESGTYLPAQEESLG